MATPNEGDIGFEVEWYPLTPRNLKLCRDEDGDYANLDCEARVLSDLEMARKLATKHAKKSVFASAMIRKVVYNRYGQWEQLEHDNPEEVCA